MSKSQLKRLAEEEERKRQEELAKGVEELDLNPTHAKEPVNKFHLLGGMEEASESEEEGQEDDLPSPTPAAISNTNKQATKKNKNNRKKKHRKNDGDLPDPDLLVEKSRTNLEMVEELFKCDPRMFDPSVELKRALGKTFGEPTSGSSQRSNGGWRPIGRLFKSKPHWPPPKTCGLEMVFDHEDGHSRWFKFTHGRNYESFERLFWYSEDTYNPDLMMSLLHDCEYHLNSLLMLANMQRMQEDFTRSVETIERGLFYCEQMFATQFAALDWKHRVDYLDYENRAFYLLLHRHMLNAAHRRCFETALNVAKLIFKFDSTNDPLGLLMIIDVMAVKAKQYTWMTTFYNCCLRWKNLDLLPNMRFSFSLALWLSTKSNAEEIFKSSIIAFPSVVRALLDEMQIQADPAVDNHEFFSSVAASREPEGLKMVTKIYTTLSSELWKQPANLAWLEKCTRELALDPSVRPSFVEWKSKRERIYVGVVPSVKRCAILVGCEPGDSVTDPLPPIAGRAKYHRDKMDEPAGPNSFWGGLLHSLHPEFERGVTLREAMARFGRSLLGIRPENLGDAIEERERQHNQDGHQQ